MNKPINSISLLEVCKLPWMLVFHQKRLICFAVKEGIIVAASDSQKRYLGRNARDVALSFHRRGAHIERREKMAPPPEVHARPAKR